MTSIKVSFSDHVDHDWKLRIYIYKKKLKTTKCKKLVCVLLYTNLLLFFDISLSGLPAYGNRNGDSADKFLYQATQKK